MGGRRFLLAASALILLGVILVGASLATLATAAIFLDE